MGRGSEWKLLQRDEDDRRSQLRVPGLELVFHNRRRIQEIGSSHRAPKHHCADHPTKGRAHVHLQSLPPTLNTEPACQSGAPRRLHTLVPTWNSGRLEPPLIC